MTSQQDPLAALQPLIEPLPVSLWPPAPGWWLLAVLLIAALIATFIGTRRRGRRAAPRRAALSELQRLDSSEPTHYLQQLNQLLKRVVLSYYPAEKATLSGREWLQFLDNTGGKNEFSTTGSLLAEGPYRPADATAEQIAALHQLAQRWIRAQPNHRLEKHKGLEKNRA